MTTQIGTASNWLDLLSKLDDFLTTNGHAWGKSFVGTSSGGDLVNYTGTPNSVAETFTLTALSSTSFSVVGSVSGALANATVGTLYTSDKIGFLITNGATYAVGDKFYISTSPKWARLRAAGCPSQNYRSSDMSDLQNLFDSDQNTYASKAATSAVIDFEMYRATEVKEFLMQASGSNGLAPKDFTLYCRDNVSDAWSVAVAYTGVTWSTFFESKTFSVSGSPGAHRYWRLAITASNGASLQIARLGLREKVADQYFIEEHCEFAFKGPGLDGTKEIFVGVETYGFTDSDTWNLGFTGFRAFDATRSVTAQPNGTLARYLALVNSPIGYWMIANGQRFILITKAAGTYQTAYCGFGLPYEPPSVHQYPEIIAASSSSRTLRYDSQSGAFQHPMDPGDTGAASGGGLVACYPDAQWRAHSNRTSANSTNSEGTFAGTNTSESYGRMWPAAMRNDADARPTFIRENIDESRPMIPGVITRTASPNHIWGEFDGYYWTTGFGTVAEATIREQGFDHLVVNNIFRTGVQHFAAVRLD